MAGGRAVHGSILILVVFALGVAARSTSLTIAAAILLLIQLVQAKRLLPLLEERGVELGLLFLMIAVLAPVALEKVGKEEIVATFSSLPGIAAIVGGVIATRLNGMGLNLLESQPQVIMGLVIGSIIGIVFLKGVPVGPLMAGGIAALFLYIIGLFSP